MYRLTDKALKAEVTSMVRLAQKESKHPAKLDHWELVIDNGEVKCLAVIIQTYDGLRQKNVAI